jgi:hypothetical protein
MYTLRSGFVRGNMTTGHEKMTNGAKSVLCSDAYPLGRKALHAAMKRSLSQWRKYINAQITQIPVRTAHRCPPPFAVLYTHNIIKCLVIRGKGAHVYAALHGQEETLETA